MMKVNLHKVGMEVTRCSKCGIIIYTRSDGKVMERQYGMYDGEWEFRDVLHRHQPTVAAYFQQQLGKDYQDD